VYSGSQSPRWSPPRAAVDIQIDALNGDPPSEVVTRALVALDGYSDHPYAPIDCDPWRTFSWRNRPSLSSGPQDPCFLPEPSVIASLPVDRWETVLRAERAHSWGKGGRWVFVPPSDWRVDDGATGTWRNGAAFRCETAPGGNHHGPVDCHGRIWEWDTVKRHWDVQLKDGRHIRINSYGVWIDASG
jgi:hypothetical protein